MWGSGPTTTALYSVSTAPYFFGSHTGDLRGSVSFFVQCAEGGIKNYGVYTLTGLSFLYILNKKKGETEGYGVFYESGSNVPRMPGNI